MQAFPDFKQSFSKLVATPSVSSIDPVHDQGNQAVITQLANWFAGIGFDCEVMPVGPGKYNLIATRGEKHRQTASGLVLSGHTDTVPYDESGWHSDPFQLTEREGNLYGLGTADMKSFFPVILETLNRLQDITLQQPITVIATADEESTMSGARMLAAREQAPGRYCIIGEPTGLKPIHSHKGIIIESFRLLGRSGHSSNPALGISALEGMTDIINALRQWRSELQSRFTNPDFAVPVPTLNLGRIEGGDSPNRICASCELSLDIRMLPGMDVNHFASDLRNIIEGSIAGTGLDIVYTGQTAPIPAMQTSPHSEIIKASEIHSAQPSACVAFATEGPFFNDIGMETVILGPGDIDVAHQPDEYLSISRIEPMIDLLSKLVTHFCVKK